MVKVDSLYLQDITRAIDKIDQYSHDITFEMFSQEEMRQDAIIRQLEIVGEATNKLSEEFRIQHADFPVKEAISMRNFLIHGYDNVDLTVVWKTIQEDIPLLKENLNKLQHI